MNNVVRRRFLFLAGMLPAAALVHAQVLTVKPVRIGILVGGGFEQRGHLERALLEGLREQGYVEGRNLVVERRYADGHSDRVGEFARELGAMKLDAVVTTCSPTTRAAGQAITATPIVMAAVADPVRQHLIVSLARPGANITGLSSQAEDILPKMLELFSGVLPRGATVAVFVQGNSQVHPRMWQQLQPVAETLGLRLERIDIGNPSALPSAFELALLRKAAAIFVLPDEPMVLTHRSTIVELAARHRLPAFYGASEFVEDGGLMSYGESLRASYRRAAYYVRHVAAGSRPADLAVEQPSRFELVVNMKTAKELGVVVPQYILMLADSVIE
jgi:putative ABC transport system substrate-binding protein